MKSHYYSQHAVALRAELGRAITRDQMREFMRNPPPGHTDWSRDEPVERPQATAHIR